MRIAEVRDAWRHALEKERRFALSRIQVATKPPLGDFDSDLPNGMVVICGLNGAGKTTLLRLVAAAINGKTNSAPLRPDLGLDGEFVVNVRTDNETTELRLSDGGSSARAVTCDAFAQCMEVRAVAAQPHFHDLLQGVEPREFTDAQVRTAEYVIGKKYDSIRVSEVENTLAESRGTADDENDDDPVLPVFSVTTGHLTYDFDTMGLGELAALIALWNFWRSQSGTILLVEEPETFLSSRATVALIDVLADAVHRQRLYAVVTTHSPSLAASVPLDAIRILTTAASHSGLHSPSSRAEIDLLLGAHAGMTRVVLVEDETARIMVEEIIGRYKGVWGRSIEVLRAEGATPLGQLCKAFPRSQRLRIIGVLDGDQTVPEDTRWPVLVLPGPTNPDALLAAAVEQRLDEFADSIARGREAVANSVPALQGIDVHDWLPALANELGVELPQAVRAAVGLWLKLEDNEQQARTLADAIESNLGQ